MVPDSKQSLAGLTTESVNPASADLSDMSPLDIVRTMNGEDALVAAAVGAEAERIADAVAGIAEPSPARRAARVRRDGNIGAPGGT